MTHSKSAEKRVRVSERRRNRNRVYLSSSRTLVRRAEVAIQSGDAEQADAAVLSAVAMLDRSAAKGIIHRNNAARRKSRLMAKLNAMKASA